MPAEFSAGASIVNRGFALSQRRPLPTEVTLPGPEGLLVVFPEAAELQIDDRLLILLVATPNPVGYCQFFSPPKLISELAQ
nr:MAG TPA: hypothetical protein [Caudoviricetes sp.]